ncbi:MAG TPA: class I SAM-dependent methyltransferase [Thermoanaerobaculia bacterium]|nr:class I SAM-dependent methyltransferase [Thermoanaerobaculia bacterium]
MSSRRAFVRALANAEFTRADPEVEQHLLALFDDDAIDWQHLARPAASLLLLDPELRESQLLHAFLRQTVNTSWRMEQRLLALRARAVSPRLAESLARQAQLNGVWGGEDGAGVATVREQYERYPYPFWLSLDRPETTDDLRAEILIAGCGTGRDAIVLALRHPRARVTAIDISASSLAYASRKAAELRVPNIEFHQQDLLTLRDAQYDAIHSVGVLHHLPDPVAGLRALAACLRDAGTMHIGVYSREARAWLREWRAIGGDAHTDDELRAARRRILSAAGDRLPELENLDFFHLGHFRDTLYHPHELDLTRDDVEAMVRDAGLVADEIEVEGSMYMCRLRKR